jgi:hypothetical protein
MVQVDLRESKEAGQKVKELGEQGALQACTSLNLEYGYHGARQTRLCPPGAPRSAPAPPSDTRTLVVCTACPSSHAWCHAKPHCMRACLCAVGNDTLSIIGSKAASLVDLNLNACQECSGAFARPGERVLKERAITT